MILRISYLPSLHKTVIVTIPTPSHCIFTASGWNSAGRTEMRSVRPSSACAHPARNRAFFAASSPSHSEEEEIDVIIPSAVRHVSRLLSKKSGQLPCSLLYFEAEWLCELECTWYFAQRAHFFITKLLSSYT